MQINLRKAANQGPQTLTLTLNERLPSYIQPPVGMACTYTIEARDNYYLVDLTVSGEVTVTCQRCLKPFIYHYTNPITIAVCGSETVAEKLLTAYESIVATDNQIDLNNVIIDELHLSCPESHEDSADCDPEIAAYIHAEKQDS